MIIAKQNQHCNRIIECFHQPSFYSLQHRYRLLGIRGRHIRIPMRWHQHIHLVSWLAHQSHLGMRLCLRFQVLQRKTYLKFSYYKHFFIFSPYTWKNLSIVRVSGITLNDWDVTSVNAVKLRGIVRSNGQSVAPSTDMNDIIFGHPFTFSVSWKFRWSDILVKRQTCFKTKDSNIVRDKVIVVFWMFFEYGTIDFLLSWFVLLWGVLLKLTEWWEQKLSRDHINFKPSLMLWAPATRVVWCGLV